VLANLFTASAIASISIAFLLWFATSSRITVYEQGMLSHNRAGSSYLGWDEIRLFAISPLGCREDTPIRYELAGEKRIMHFSRAQQHVAFHPSQADTAVKPDMDFAEYEQQMDLIVALIASKTRLPLVDLRRSRDGLWVRRQAW
jgi:hypothetical protein